MNYLKILLPIILGISISSKACSIVYFIDEKTGTIYVANNEDYWLDTKAYVQYMSASKKEIARVWYGWRKFAQGGINQAGLFFDAAITPKQSIPKGYHAPNGRNIGDEILATCKTIKEALDFLENEKIAIPSGHMMFGDKHGNAVVVEWIAGKRTLNYIKNNVLIATNYLLAKPEAGGYPCYRYESIQKRIDILKQGEVVSFLGFGNTLGGAAVPPNYNLENEKASGTLYSSFINITEMKLFIVPKLDNNKVIKLDLNEWFLKSKRKKIKL